MSDDTRIGYDRVAEHYASRFISELDDKPYDRHLLNCFAELVSGQGMVCDIGTGPGQIARYLHRQGVDAMGVDLSPNMVAQARQRTPGLRFEQADMRSLPFAAGQLAGITAFYSVIHIPRAGVTAVLHEFKRCLQPSGWLLLAFHIGDEVRHLDSFFDQPVSLDFTFFQVDEMGAYIDTAGFSRCVTAERAPYAQEHASQRGYILAQNAS